MTKQGSVTAVWRCKSAGTTHRGAEGVMLLPIGRGRRRMATLHRFQVAGRSARASRRIRFATTIARMLTNRQPKALNSDSSRTSLEGILGAPSPKGFETGSDAIQLRSDITRRRGATGNGRLMERTQRLQSVDEILNLLTKMFKKLLPNRFVPVVDGPCTSKFRSIIHHDP